MNQPHEGQSDSGGQVCKLIDFTAARGGRVGGGLQSGAEGSGLNLELGQRRESGVAGTEETGSREVGHGPTGMEEIEHRE